MHVAGSLKSMSLKAGKGACMEMTAFDPDSSTNGMLNTGSDAPRNRHAVRRRWPKPWRTFSDKNPLSAPMVTRGSGRSGRRLSQTVKPGAIIPVCICMGKSERRASRPSRSIGPVKIRQTGTVTEALLAAFAREAAEVHVARCDGIKEYLTLAPFFSQPVPRYHRTKKMALVLLGVAALLTAYWWWKDFDRTGPTQPDRQAPPHRLQWQPLQISHQYPAGEPFEFPLPRLERMPEGMPVDVTLEASGDQPGWLQLDRERLHIRGTAPLMTANRTYRLSVRAHTAQGGDSRLLILLTIAGPPEQSAPVRQLPGHWTW